jgi:hypothetical protein
MNATLKTNKCDEKSSLFKCACVLNQSTCHIPDKKLLFDGNVVLLINVKRRSDKQIHICRVFMCGILKGADRSTHKMHPFEG